MSLVRDGPVGSAFVDEITMKRSETSDTKESSNEAWDLRLRATPRPWAGPPRDMDYGRRDFGRFNYNTFTIFPVFNWRY